MVLEFSLYQWYQIDCVVEGHSHSFLSWPQTLEVYCLNPILPLITHFRAQFDISRICTLQKSVDILYSLVFFSLQAEDCWFWSIFLWSPSPTLALYLVTRPSFFPSSVMLWVVFLELIFYSGLPPGIKVIISVLGYSLLDLPGWTVKRNEKIWNLLAPGAYCLNRKVSNWMR